MHQSPRCVLRSTGKWCSSILPSRGGGVGQGRGPGLGHAGRGVWLRGTGGRGGSPGPWGTGHMEGPAEGRGHRTTEDGPPRDRLRGFGKALHHGAIRAGETHHGANQ